MNCILLFWIFLSWTYVGPKTPLLLQRLRLYLPSKMEELKVPGAGIAVVEKRRIAGTLYLGKRKAGERERIDGSTVFEACSMSKPLFSYAVLKLAEKGIFDIDKPLDSYLGKPFVKGDKRSGMVTARMVMTHTTGLPNWRRGKPLAFICDPGKRYTYSGEGFTWLTLAVEKAIHEPLHLWMEKNILKPMGMERSSYIWKRAFQKDFAWGHGYKGEPKRRRPFLAVNAAYSLYTTPRDYAMFLVEMLRNGKPEKKWRLSQRHKDLMIKPIFRTGKNKYRSLGFVVTVENGKAYVSHSGHNKTGFRCCSWFSPEDGCGIVVMTNGEAGNKLCSFVMKEFRKVFLASKEN